MTQNEFLSEIKQRGAIIWPANQSQNIQIINSVLQSHKCAMLPMFIQELYKTVGAINIGNAYIFGPSDISRGIIASIPDIISINDKLKNTPSVYGKTIFGRNDLFWFAFDAFGKCYMLDNLTLRTMRQYDDAYRAMLDCLVAGKF